MQTIVKTFISELHRSKLKPKGFRKIRHRFYRNKETYIEYFDIQGSSWNSSNSPWRFYLNTAIDFIGIPKRNSVQFHAEGRIEWIVKGYEPHFELSTETYENLLIEVPLLIEKASVLIPDLLPAVRQRVEKGLVSTLPIMSWMKE